MTREETRRYQIYLVPIFVTLVLIVFLVRMLFLIYFPSEKLKKFSKRQYDRIINLSERRGDIYDIKGNPLASTISLKSLYADPSIISSNHKKLTKKLSQVLGLSYTRLLKKISSKRHFVWLKRKMTDFEYRKLKKLIKDTKGLNVVSESKRSYPNRSLASHVIGFVNIDSKGIAGVEAFYDRYLRGTKSKYSVKYKRDAKGRMIYENGKIFERAESANSIYLTIDASLQYQIESILTDAQEYYKAKSITAIVMDPDTGELISLANMPTFDPNIPGNYPVASRRNRAITDIYEPGSTFKIITAGIGLKEKLVNEDTKIWCENGRFNVNGRIIREAEGHNFKWLSLKEIIAKSSNVGTAKLAFMIGFEKFFSGIEIFGIGRRTGIDLPGEVRGLVRKVRNKVMLATMAFGQGIAVTPIQMVQAYAIIANGGLEVIPHVVKKVATSKKDIFVIPKDMDRVQIIPHSVSDKLKDMLRLVVQKGTGVGTNIKGFEIAGKTGTAQKPDPKHGGYYKDKYILSFAGFFPADSPKFVIIVVVDEPKKGIYASTVAVPIFRRISNVLIQSSKFTKHNLKVSKKFIKIPQKTRFKLRTNMKKLSKVPSYIGMSLKDFVRTLDIEWKDIIIDGSGRIYKQVPKAGTQYNKKLILQLYLK